MSVVLFVAIFFFGIVVYIAPFYCAGMIVRLIFRAARRDLLAVFAALAVLFINEQFRVFPLSPTFEIMDAMIKAAPTVGTADMFPDPIVIPFILIGIVGATAIPAFAAQEGVRAIDKVRKKYWPPSGGSNVSPVTSCEGKE